MSDRLTLAEAIEDAGIERAKAVRIATAIVDTTRQTVATKADLEAGAATVRADFAGLRGELREGFARIETRFAAVEIKFAEASAQADGRFARQDVGIERLRSEVHGMENRLLIRIVGPLGSLLVVTIGALFWGLQHWPPH